ncbi:MAG: DUF2804 domain-containing protein [Desulfobacterales bacterium]|nr:DUF2804 domain-containing protein [Desulfobacterales bacterium]
MQQTTLSNNKSGVLLLDGAANFGAHAIRFNPIDMENLLKIEHKRFSIQQFREKRWSYLGILNPRVILGCAVIHLGYVASAFIFAFDRQDKRMLEHTMILPPISQVRFDRHPDQGICSFSSLRTKIIMSHDINSGVRRLNTNMFLIRNPIKTQIVVSDSPEFFSPLQVIIPMENGKVVFTNKEAGLHAEGSITMGNKTFELKPEETWAIFDWTDGFFNRNTFWNWACGAGRSSDGTRIGFNFSAGVYENGVLENVIWIDGEPITISEVKFIYDNKNPMTTWRVQSVDGNVNLQFEPEGIRSANDNIGIMASRFMQPCGNFSGIIKNKEGQILNLTSVAGVVEEHYAKW